MLPMDIHVQKIALELILSTKEVDKETIVMLAGINTISPARWKVCEVRKGFNRKLKGSRERQIYT